MYKRSDVCLKKVAFLLSIIFIFAGFSGVSYAEDLVPEVKSAFLIEPSTGTVIYEQNADEHVFIASVTKIMTMLIIMEKIDAGELSPDDIVTGSKNAKSYGGSTMYLDEGEQFTVRDMLKGIAVVSANDGCVAMAEHIAGSTDAFVGMMNKRAKELGMKDTLFANCNGLDDTLDSTQVYSTARDVAKMSAELIKHKEIFDYTSILSDSLRDGKFQLISTNKQFLNNYQGATGLKTGYTSKAGYCLCATANRDGVEFLAVVLGAPNANVRVAAAKKLLDYGYDNYIIERMTEADEKVGKVNVSWGEQGTVSAKAAEGYAILKKKSGEPEIKKSVKMEDRVYAPVKKGDKLGVITYTQNGKTIKAIDIIAGETVEKKGFFAILLAILRMIFI